MSSPSIFGQLRRGGKSSSPKIASPVAPSPGSPLAAPRSPSPSPHKKGGASAKNKSSPAPVKSASIAEVLDQARWSVSPYNKQLARDSNATAHTPDVWSFEVKTGDVEHAGCKSKVYIDVYGSTGGMFGVCLNPNGEKFSRGSSVTITVDDPRGLPVGRLRKIRVRHDDTSSNPSWFLEKITAYHDNGNAVSKPLSGGPTGKVTEQYEFKCSQWLSHEYGDKEMVRELAAAGPFCEKRPPQLCQSTKYLVRVFTGDPQGVGSQAGTDALVHIKLDGRDSDTGLRPLLRSTTPQRDLFEHGQIDEFELWAVGLGEIRKLRIGHNNTSDLLHKLHSRGGAGWYLDKVVVIDPTAPNDYNTITFPCDRWLHKGKDDGHTERELVPEVPGNPATYTITTWTRRGAPGPLHRPPHPELVLWGELLGAAASTKRTLLDRPDGAGTKYRAFGSDAVDTFAKELTFVGELTHVTLRYAGKRPVVEAVTKTTKQELYTSGHQHFDAANVTEGARNSPAVKRKLEKSLTVGQSYVWKPRKLEIRISATIDGELIDDMYFCEWPADDAFAMGEGHSQGAVRMPLTKHVTKDNTPKDKKSTGGGDPLGTWTASGLWVRQGLPVGARPTPSKATDCWNRSYTDDLRSRAYRTTSRQKASAETDAFMEQQQNAQKETGEEKKKRSDLAVKGIEKRFKQIQAAKRSKEKKAHGMQVAKKKAADDHRKEHEPGVAEWRRAKGLQARAARAAQFDAEQRAHGIRRTRDALNNAAFNEWKRGKSKSASAQQQQNMRTHRTDTAAAQRCSRNRKAAKHFCPVPMSGAPNGGYCEVKGGTGRPGRDIGPPSQTRWFYGGREAAGLSDADTWEY